jgi:hypothetical protein
MPTTAILGIWLVFCAITLLGAANAPSGGRLSHIELGEFLRGDAKGPEHQALLRVIGTLVEMPPFAS